MRVNMLTGLALAAAGLFACTAYAQTIYYPPSFYSALQPSTGAALPTSLDTYNFDPNALSNIRICMGRVRHGDAGVRCTVLALGDSKTAGVGDTPINYRPTVSYPARLVYWLNQLGVPAQGDNWVASGNDPNADNRLTFVGNANQSGAAALAGPMEQTYGAGDGFNFTLPVAAAYDHVDIGYANAGGATVGVAVDGGAVIQSITPSSSGMGSTSVSLTAGSHSVVNIRQTSASGQFFLQSIRFWSSTVPKVEVLNGGSGGADSTAAIQQPLTGFGYFSGAVLEAPNLVVVDFSTNDCNNNTYPPATTTANVFQTLAYFKALGVSVIGVVTEPYGGAYYAPYQPVFRTDMQAQSLAQDVPLVDWSNRYGNTSANINMPSTLHPPSWEYDDIAHRLADLMVGQ